MFSIIYTPTEGDAIADYSRLFRRPEGCFLNIGDIDRVEDDISQWGNPEDIDIIVVSDGEQILGIGDQGVGAILISVAKLVIYSLCAGIHPSRTLPVVLDCGTDVSFLVLSSSAALRIMRTKSYLTMNYTSASECPESVVRSTTDLLRLLYLPARNDILEHTSISRTSA